MMYPDQSAGYIAELNAKKVSICCVLSYSGQECTSQQPEVDDHICWWPLKPVGPAWPAWRGKDCEYS